MKFLFVDFFSSSNRGDAGILEGMRADFLSVDNEADIEVLCYHKESVRTINGMFADDVLIPEVPRSARALGFIVFLLLLAKCKMKRPPAFLPERKARIIRKYMRADLIVSVGGGNLNDNYSQALFGRLLGLLFAKWLGKKVILYGQSVGPFNKPFYRKLARYVFDKLDFIILREQGSKDIVDDLGVAKPKIAVTTDCAFSVKIVGKNVKSQEKYVTLSIRSWAYNDYDEKLRNEMASFIEWLTLCEGYRVYFLSTCTGFLGYHADDRLVGSKIGESLSPKAKLAYSVVEEDKSVNDLTAFYSGACFHVGMRLHSCIFSFVAGTPFIPIMYEHKTEGLADQMGFQEFLVEGQEVDALRLIDLSKKIIEKNERYRELIAKRKKKIRALIARNRSLLKGIIG